MSTQPARATRGRSPDSPFGEVDSTRLPLLVTASVLGTVAALAATVLADAQTTAGLIGLLSFVVALGFPSLWRSPSETRVQLVIAVTGVLIAATVGLNEGTTRLVWLPVVIAGGLISAFFLQLLRTDGRSGLTEAMSVTITGLATISSGATLVPLASSERGARFVVLGLICLAVGALAELAGRRPKVGGRASLLVLVAGGLTGVLLADAFGFGWSTGLGLGMVLASFSHSARRIFGAVPGVREPAGQVALGVATVLLPGVLMFALGASVRL
ncbi:MAG: hypothetical protein IPL45_11745 [Actinomycetales bacterium]|nr:hypothetical protein [Actinomycetales bacterium]